MVTTAKQNIGLFGENLSIMIPNYNGAIFIGRTLASLKAQGSSLDNAQIEVLDNCSTDASREVVENVWPGRVRWRTHSRNIGFIPNFNACIDCAERHWIHILHSDDYMLPYAYKEVSTCLDLVPEASAVFARSVTVDDQDQWVWLPKLLGPGSRGEFDYKPVEWRNNLVQFAGVLFAKQVVEDVGLFNPNLYAVSDWNLWWRIAKSRTVAYSNTCIAAYRTHEGNITSQVKRTAQNTKDSLKQLDLLFYDTTWAKANSCVTRHHIYSEIYGEALWQCLNFLDDKEAFTHNYRALSQFPKEVHSNKARLHLYGRYLKRRLKNWHHNRQQVALCPGS